MYPMIFRLKYLYFGANYKEISLPFLIPISPIPCKNCPWMKTAIAIPSLSFPFFSNKRDFERENEENVWRNWNRNYLEIHFQTKKDSEKKLKRPYTIYILRNEKRLQSINSNIRKEIAARTVKKIKSAERERKKNLNQGLHRGTRAYIAPSRASL